MDESIDQEVARRMAEIEADPTRFEPYDIDGNGRLDANERGRLEAIVRAEVLTEEMRRLKQAGPGAAESQAEDGGLVKDRYRRIKPLGSGGQAATFLAEDTTSDRRVVLKQLHVAHIDNWKAVELFEREAETLAQLNHPAVPSYVDAFHLDAGADEGFWLVQEFIEGQTLEALIDGGARFSEDEAKAFMLEVLDIFTYLHGLNPPVVHRDVKPSNLMRRTDGRWVLIDFGAIQAKAAATSGGSTIIGTTGYMAPEQFLGRAEPATDLYALGATVVHMLSHVHPADLPLKRMKLDYRKKVKTSDHLLDVLDKLLAPSVEDRFRSAKQVTKALAKPPKPKKVAGNRRRSAPRKKSESSGQNLATWLGLAAVGFGFIMFFTTPGSEPPEVKKAETTAPAPVAAAPGPAPRQVAAARKALPKAQYGAPRIDITKDGVRMRGSLLTLVVFSEFQCPFCARLESTLEGLIKRHDDLRVVFKHFPLDFHKRARPAAGAAICARFQDNSYFWKLHETLMANYRALEDDQIRGYANEAGVNMTLWDRCMASEGYAKQLEGDIKEGKAHGVRGTPTTFLNGRRLTGAQPPAKFEAIIQVERERAQALVKSGVPVGKVYSTILDRIDDGSWQKGAGSP